MQFLFIYGQPIGAGNFKDPFPKQMGLEGRPASYVPTNEMAGYTTVQGVRQNADS